MRMFRISFSDSVIPATLMLVSTLLQAYRPVRLHQALSRLVQRVHQQRGHQLHRRLARHLRLLREL